MSFSYSAIVNSGSGQVTLPSVDSWGTNMNILRDPPKGIMTQRKTRVGDTMDLVVTQDDSETRSCEAILQYARGVNPMVSVSYSNSDGRPSKLPQTISNGGVFRPPLITQAQQFPLSRQPRNWVSVNSNPEVMDFSKSVQCCKPVEKTRECRNNILKASCRPTAVYQVMMPAQESVYEVKKIIQNPIRTTANSGLRSMDITNRNVGVPLKEIDDSKMSIYAQSNVTQDKYVNVNGQFNSSKYIQDNMNIAASANFSDNIYVNNNGDFRSDKYIQDNRNIAACANVSENIYVNGNGDFNSDKYIQDSMYINASTNGSLDIQVTPIDELFDMSDVRVKDTIHTNYKTNSQGPNKTNYISTNVALERNLPEYYATTNVNNGSVHKRVEYDKEPALYKKTPNTFVASNANSSRVSLNDEVSSRSYNRLKEKIVPGEYYGKAAVPVLYRSNDIKNLTSRKNDLSHLVSSNYNNKYTPQIVA